MNKTNKIIVGIIIVVIIIAGVWYRIEKNSIEEEVIKIGAILPLTGEAAAWGQASQRGIELAVGETNKNNKKIEMVYEDSQGSASNAVSAYEKLTKINKVDAIIGPLLQMEVSAIAPLADRDKFPVITPSYTPISNRSDPRNPLLIWLDATVEAENIASYVYDQGISTVSVLGTQDSWEKEVSMAFANKFESLGGEVSFIDLLKIDEMDVKTSATMAIKNKPDAIFLGTYYQFLNLIRVFKELGYQGKLYSIEVDEYLANESKGFSSGLQFISSGSYKEEFKKKFEEVYRIKSNIPAGQSYDAMNILISFLIKNPTQDNLLNSFRMFEKYDGVSGIITMTDDNRTIIPTAIYELNNGTIKKIE